MNIKILQKFISEGFYKNVVLKEKRPGLYQVFMPFYYPDGDMLEIFLKADKDENSVIIQDMGLTLMRLSYNFNLDSKNKRKVFNEILDNYQIKEVSGNLQITAPVKSIFSYLMQFAQTIIKVSDLEFLKREIVRSLFYEYFDKFMIIDLSELKPIKDYYPDFDTEKQYPTPYALPVHKKEPICVYAIASDDKCNEVTIIGQHYELHGFKPETMAVFENQESIARKPLARLSNVIGKQFSSFQGNEDKIKEYIKKRIMMI